MKLQYVLLVLAICLAICMLWQWAVFGVIVCSLMLMYKASKGWQRLRAKFGCARAHGDGIKKDTNR